MSEYCYSLKAESFGEYQEKGSRFLGYAFPCADEAAFAERLHALKEEHLKARHYCYAWRFGELGEAYRAYDDGEPSGTAGLPIYNQLRAFEVSDCAVVVVRYFGGTLLGAPGLVKAYKTAAKMALECAERVRIVPQAVLTVCLDYADINTLMTLIVRFDFGVIAREMQMRCTFTLQGPRDNASVLREALLHARFAVHE